MQLGRRASFLLPLSFSACRRSRSPEGAGEAFLDAYYIERDHQRALALVAEGALARVQREKELLGGGAGGGSGDGPRVYYAQKGASADGPSGTALTYELTIRASGVRLQKEVQLTVRKYGEEGYKVSAFTERDLPEPAAP